MKRMSEFGRRVQTPGALVPMLMVLVLGLGLAGCGGSDESGAEELAKQQELRAVREQAAKDARQSTKIEELERKLRRRGARASGNHEPPPGTSDSFAGESLLGVWRGEAVIYYQDGKSDPFVETIQINSVAPGQFTGNAEAVQGSTTCHGPLSFQGVTEGWYSFSSEEQNVAECIDFSQVELKLGESGVLSYRETTDVSVSEGGLQRVP